MCFRIPFLNENVKRTSFLFVFGFNENVNDAVIEINLKSIKNMYL